MSAAAVGLALLAFIIVMVMLYTLPTIIAFGRRHPNRWLILIVNIAVGGTVVGWLVALIWALKAAHLAEGRGQTDGGQSGLNLFANDTQVIRVEHVQPRTVEIQAYQRHPAARRSASLRRPTGSKRSTSCTSRAGSPKPSTRACEGACWGSYERVRLRLDPTAATHPGDALTKTPGYPRNSPA